MDNSLDDFFAKKDKSNKKKGKKSKIVVSDLIPSSSPTPPNESNDTTTATADPLSEQFSEVKVESSRGGGETVKEKKKQRKKKDKEGADSKSKEEDEWNEVKNEVDYSGLRIATKSIAKEAAEEAADNARLEPEYDEDGQIIERSSEGKVWKMPTAEPRAETSQPEPAPVIAKMPNVSEGKYIPPGQRGGASKDLAPVSIKRPGRKKQAPNVNSQEDFPTLGAAPPPIDYDVSNFERVRGGGSSQQASSQSGPGRVETSNMYSALERR